jgi:uncharacterized membrane protein
MEPNQRFSTTNYTHLINATTHYISLSVMVCALLIGSSTGKGALRGTDCPPVYFELIGDLPGDAFDSEPFDISADGSHVVGGSWADDPDVPTDGGSYLVVDGGRAHALQAFGWTRPCRGKPFFPEPAVKPPGGWRTGIIGLGYYFPSDPSESAARGISPDGQVLCGWCYVGSGGLEEAFLFQMDGTKTRLGKLPGDQISEAADISQSCAGTVRETNFPPGPPAAHRIAHQRITVGYSSSGNNHPNRVLGGKAVYWGPRPGEMTALPMPGSLPNGQPILSAEAICVSDDASVIGGNLYDASIFFQVGYHMRSVACIWTLHNRHPGFQPNNDSNYSFTLLNALPGGLDDAVITHISGNGKVVVGISRLPDGQRACLWELGPNGWGPPQDLGLLSGMNYAKALGVNQNGSVIVGEGGLEYDPDTGNYRQLPVRWERHNGVATPQNLVDIFKANNIGPKIDDRWQMSAVRVSADGRTIVGVSSHPDFTSTDPNAGVTEGWVAQLP